MTVMGEIVPPKVDPMSRRSGGSAAPVSDEKPEVSITSDAPPQNTNVQIKSGYKTSEFYSPLIVGAVVSLVIPAINSRYHLALDATDVTNAILVVVGSVGTIISTVAYIVGRAKVKSAAINVASQK